MNVTPDVIGTIVAGLALVATIFGGLFFLMRRLESRLELSIVQSRELSDAVNAVRFDRIDNRFKNMDDRFDRMDARFDKMDAEIVDLKVSVARLEGPQPTLLRSR